MTRRASCPSLTRTAGCFERWFFRDGRVGYAGLGGATLGTRLGEAPVPPLEEINAETEFDGDEVDAVFFESLWSAYASAAR